MFTPTDLKFSPEKLSRIGHALFDARERIIGTWAKRVRSEIGPAKDLSEPVLVDTLPAFLDNLAEALSKQDFRLDAVDGSTVGYEHGAERAHFTHFKPWQIVREYQILRTIIFVELNKMVELPPIECAVINQSIDEAVQNAISQFSEAEVAVRKQFMATLTHDLRNPLGVARMAVDAIAWEPDSRDIPMLAAKAVENLDRVNRMIQDLLDTTYVNTGGKLILEISQFDLRDMVKSVVQRMSLAHGQAMRTELVSVQGHWDKDKLERALENLIGNAFKYGDRDKPVIVKLVTHHQRINLVVHNEGRPISKEDQLHIFEPFRRSKTAALDTKKQGWGLGLALVRGVALAHGGSVVVDSSAERGTTFLVDIPNDARPFK